jgi:hypothetical protein
MTASYTSLKEFMFTSENIENINNSYKNRVKSIRDGPGLKHGPVIKHEPGIKHGPVIKHEPGIKHEPVIKHGPVIKHEPCMSKKEENFTPLQKDKLFWCFYIILKGIDEYEMNKNSAFATEKKFKIDTVEKLRLMKDKLKELKELKIKRNEIEDELANKDCITTKGLQVLCLIYKISIIYISGKKYSEFLFAETDKITGIIEEMSELTVKTSIDLEYISHVKKNYWFIENIQKPLNAPSAYTIKDLQDISTKLGINLVSNLGKNKTKQLLYEEILTKL